MELVQLIMDFIGVVILGFLTLSDIKTKKISVLIPLAFGACSIFIPWDVQNISNALLGGIPGVMLLTLHRPSKGQIGIGDGLMLLGMGLHLGLQKAFTAWFYSLGILFVFSCIGLMMKKLKPKSQVPFAPFYLAAYIGVVVL